MTIDDAKVLGELHLEDKNLLDWRITFNNAKSKLGHCDYMRKEISLSIPILLINSEEKVENTILHEIAHALVGYIHGHDEVWRQKCLEIGGNGKTCSDDHVRVQASYKAQCPHCGKEYSKFRQTKIRRACSDCCQKYNFGKFTEKFLLCFEKQSN